MHPKGRGGFVLSTRVFSVVLFFSLFITLSPFSSHAQFGGTGAQGVDLIVSPEFPNPNTLVEITLSDYTVDTAGADILWYVGGEERRELRNERSIQTQTGSLGEKLSVRVVLSRTNAPMLSKTITITPSQVDIILEANTYVPDFYRGRALPSAESSVRAIAVVNDGTKTPASLYTYRWSENGEILLGGPMKGKSVLPFTMSRYEDGYLTVEVSDANGNPVGEKSMILVAKNPELHFYEHSPLRGLFEKAIIKPIPLIGEEISVYGEPYFLDASLVNEEADFTWEINGAPTNAEQGEPNAITLRQVGGGGQAEVSLQVVTKKRIPQVVEKVFQIFFE